MTRRLVLLSVTSAQRGTVYVAALEAAGVPARDIRIVVAGDPPSGPAGGAPGFAASSSPRGAPDATTAFAGATVALAGAPAAVGATPAVATTPGCSLDAGALADLLDEAAGLVLGGGADVEPERYGEEPLPAAGLELWPRRDALEWELLAAARERRLPVWGVCRGFQVLNVFLGGTLWQDLPAQRPSQVAHDMDQQPDLLAHPIEVLAAGSPLGERLAGAGPRPWVNSRHHQGVKRLASGLLPAAAAPDGLIEAAMLAGDGQGDAGHTGGGWWVRGVAWHPENLISMPEQLALWQDFAAAALGVAAAAAKR